MCRKNVEEPLKVVRDVLDRLMKWKNRVNGGDWFDFEWHIHNGTALNLRHLFDRVRQSKHWQRGVRLPTQFMELLKLTLS